MEYIVSHVMPNVILTIFWTGTRSGAVQKYVSRNLLWLLSVSVLQIGSDDMVHVEGHAEHDWQVECEQLRGILD